MAFDYYWQDMAPSLLTPKPVIRKVIKVKSWFAEMNYVKKSFSGSKKAAVRARLLDFDCVLTSDAFLGESGVSVCAYVGESFDVFHEQINAPCPTRCLYLGSNV